MRKLKATSHNLIGTREAALQLGIHRATLWEWVSTGAVKAAVAAGDRYYFDRDMISRLADELGENKTLANVKRVTEKILEPVA